MTFENQSENGQFAEAQPPQLAPIDESPDSELVVAEPRKPAISRSTLLMFGVLALGAAGVWMMYQRIGGPRNAVASVESAKAKSTIEAFLSGGGTSIAGMQSMLRDTEKVVQQFLAYPSMTQVPLSDLRTNPFRLKSQHSNDAPADDMLERRRREEQRLAMLKAVQALQLQSIMYSDTRKACMINDKMFREGEQVDVFTLEKITASSVIVKNDVYRFELRMQR